MEFILQFKLNKLNTIYRSPTTITDHLNFNIDVLRPTHSQGSGYTFYPQLWRPGYGTATTVIVTFHVMDETDHDDPSSQPIQMELQIMHHLSNHISNTFRFRYLPYLVIYQILYHLCTCYKLYGYCKLCVLSLFRSEASQV